MNRQVHASWRGLTPYEKFLEYQQDLHTSCLESGHLYVLGMEHPPLISLGKRGRPELDILWPEDRLSQSLLHVHTSDRGGQATLHAPGQLVIYPILPLRELGLGARAYVQSLIQITQKCLSQLGVKTQCQTKEPGLFVNDKKIAAFGIRIQKGISQHGISINCRNNLDLFDSIRSCGVSGQAWTHLGHEGVWLTPEDLFKKWIAEFSLTSPYSEA